MKTGKRKVSHLRSSKMKVVYICGPYTGSGETSKIGNILVAKNAAIDIWSMGHAVVCPHMNTMDFELHDIGSSIPYETWIEGDLAILKRCDAVVILPGWEASRGAKEEVQFALANKIPIYYWPDVKELVK